jgi:hypothetical protein
MRYNLLIGLFFLAGSIFAQEGETKVFTVPCSEFVVTESLIDIEAVAGTGDGDANKEINPIRQRRAMTHLQNEFKADRAVQTLSKILTVFKIAKLGVSLLRMSAELLGPITMFKW